MSPAVFSRRRLPTSNSSPRLLHLPFPMLLRHPTCFPLRRHLPRAASCYLLHGRYSACLPPRRTIPPHFPPPPPPTPPCSVRSPMCHLIRRTCSPSPLESAQSRHLKQRYLPQRCLNQQRRQPLTAPRRWPTTSRRHQRKWESTPARASQPHAPARNPQHQRSRPHADGLAPVCTIPLHPDRKTYMIHLKLCKRDNTEIKLGLPPRGRPLTPPPCPGSGLSTALSTRSSTIFPR
jgi:hypothetical protein